MEKTAAEAAGRSCAQTTRRAAGKAEKLDREIRELQREQNRVLRRQRSHRLIQAGAIVEHVLGRKLEDDDLERLLNTLMSVEACDHFITRRMNAGREDGDGSNRET